jgi:uncharacterized protein
MNGSGGSGHARMLLAVGPVRGDVEALESLLAERAEEADSIAVVGDLAGPGGGRAAYRALAKVLGGTGRPTFWVPGPGDAPASDYLVEAYNMEIAYPSLRGLHGTAAIGAGAILFAGMGGEIVDDPKAPRDEEGRLRYPGWEAEYRLKIVREFRDYPSVLLFATPPAHKGLQRPGSSVVAELINTYAPRVAVVPAEAAEQVQLGNTLVVSPGSLEAGDAARVDVIAAKLVTPSAA